MRLPYPERLKWTTVILFIFALFTAQLIEGTNVYFAGLIGVYTVIFTLAFNAAGGMQYTSGAFIFFTGLLVVHFGAVYKLFTGEKGESHLAEPVTTILVYCGGMGAMWAAASLSRRLRPKKALLSGIASQENMFVSAIGCLILGVFLNIISGGENTSSATVGSFLRQANRFPQLAILLATTYELNKSNGTKATNWVVWGGIGWTFFLGVVFTSKEGMFLGTVTWLLAAWAGGYNFRRKDVIGGGLFIFVMLYYLIPYSAYVRNFRDKEGNTTRNRETAFQYIFKLGDVRKMALEDLDTVDYQQAPHFYNHEQGFFDRLSMFAYDDALIARTDDGYVEGLYPTYHAFLNVVPHFIWPNKPAFFTANEYGRELGVLGEDDTTTGISFSPVADAYHQATWFGVLAVFPIILFIYFLLSDTFVGAVRDSPWPLLSIALVTHLAPEGMVDGIVLQFTEGSAYLLMLGYTVRYVFPVVMRVLTGGDRTVVRKTIEFRLGVQPLIPPGGGGPDLPAAQS